MSRSLPSYDIAKATEAEYEQLLNDLSVSGEELGCFSAGGVVWAPFVDASSLRQTSSTLIFDGGRVA